MGSSNTGHPCLDQQLPTHLMLGVRRDAVHLDADPFLPSQQMSCPDTIDRRDAHRATPLGSATRDGNGLLASLRGLGGGGGGAGLGSVCTFSSWMLLISRRSSLISLSNDSGSRRSFAPRAMISSLRQLCDSIKQSRRPCGNRVVTVHGSNLR